MSPHWDTWHTYPPDFTPPTGFRPPPPHWTGRPRISHTYYQYATAAVLLCGSIALLVIFWKCCRHKGGRSGRSNGRVIAQPPPQEPVKPTPPPYSFSEYDNPPPYHVCVPDVYQQPAVAGGSGDIAGSHNATTASAPTKYPSPEPQIHAVTMPRY